MKIAVFPGSFDPFTLAHQDLVERAIPLFDKVIIAVGYNANKKGMLDHDERVSTITEVFQGVKEIEVVKYEGLTVDFCQKIGARFILRGLRNTNDFEFENAIAQNNLLLNSEVESYFLMSRSGKAHISSSIVRDVWFNGGDVAAMVPEAVLLLLDKKIK
ncbi:MULTISPECIES: pantetheine-phosphate adenylyltransferase [unclassified Sphingobacterium]|uniref:pantetheine-phosphate adenylyltransferase n=1 Tax=unclassified Sphingobacterium TaxID=2609468 RepID=UPI002952FC4C|nr:pantetheine-phosphate adenylyltransferase [Sphingobacterium sp. UGAL515B_05]WON93912.1 pantetheine-phosphate adenylyltransferase [Sphingobacterium sp. UGAL515B_05]